MQDAGGLRRMAAYSLMGLYGVVSLCIVFHIPLPWVFATPTIFAVVTYVYLLSVIGFLGMIGASHFRFKFVLMSSALAILVLFPRHFGGQELAGFFGFRCYVILTFILAANVLNIAWYSVSEREAPAWLVVCLAVALLLLTHAFWFPQTSSDEYLMLAVCGVVGALIGICWGWITGRGT